MYTYTYIIYRAAGSSSILAFITPLLSAYFRLDLLLTWLNEKILTCFNIALDVFSIIISGFIPCRITVRMVLCLKKKKKAKCYSILERCLALAHCPLLRGVSAQGKRCPTAVQIARDTCCTEDSSRVNLKFISGRDLLLKRMTLVSLILINKVSP